MDEHDDDLRARLDRLPREVPPGRDLWPGIAKGLERSPRRAPGRARLAFPVLALAASVVLALGLHGWRGRHPSSPMASSVPESVTTTATPPVASAAPPLAGEADYQGAELALSTELEARRGAIPASEVRVLDESLRLFDDAIAEAREALRAHPEDAELRAELDRVWEDKIDLMRQATELPGGP